MRALSSLRDTAELWLFGLAKIPLIAFVRPRVESLGDGTCAIRIPLRFRTRNHLGSMYLGVLAIGADLAPGMLVLRAMQSSGAKYAFVFKAMEARFLKRVEGDCLFVCDAGPEIEAMMAKAADSGQREETQVRVRALVPQKFGEDPAAVFTMTLSVKRRS